FHATAQTADTAQKGFLLPAIVGLSGRHFYTNRIRVATSAHHMLTPRRIARCPIEPLLRKAIEAGFHLPMHLRAAETAGVASNRPAGFARVPAGGPAPPLGPG